MPKKKDSLIIGAVLLISVVLFIVSRVMPKTDLNQKTADVTLAPDAVEYLDATPEASAEPTDSPKATPEPTAVRKKPYRLRRRLCRPRKRPRRLSRQKHRSPQI